MTEQATYQRTWENRRARGRSVADESRDSYYGVPPLHKPHWKWLVVCYFFFGGIAGASYVLATVADWFGGRAGRPIVRAGRYLSLAALLPCPPLLILDLGRPERFHHMLRIFKFRSPMSVGTWGLTVFGAFCTVSALLQAASDLRLRWASLGGRSLARIIGLLGAGPALFVAGYTGVLLAATAVPIWAKNALLMGPLFLSSAMSTATAAITLLLAGFGRTNHDTLRRLERLDSITLLVEAALLLASRANLGPVLGRPIAEGRLATLRRAGVLGIGIVLPLLLQAPAALLGRSVPRPIAALAAILVLAGGFILRYVMVMAGHASADDPQSTFTFARQDRH